MTEVAQFHQAFQHNYYLFRRKVFKLFGGAFHVFDDSGNLVFYSKQRAFRLREDFSIYADKEGMQELLTIKTPQILDIGATYNVQDATTGEKVGALRRKGLKSFFRDEWTFLSKENQEIGTLTESRLLGAFLSRSFNLIPQKYEILSTDGRVIARIQQHFNPFVLKYSMNIEEHSPSIDRRLLVAAGILLAAIERRQE